MVDGLLYIKRFKGESKNLRVRNSQSFEGNNFLVKDDAISNSGRTVKLCLDKPKTVFYDFGLHHNDIMIMLCAMLMYESYKYLYIQ